MRPPTANAITQGMHGTFNAVDYSSAPDPDFYAPEDATIVSYAQNGDCGNNLQMDGPTGRHGFCHVEYINVAVGARVNKGQKLGRMGYNGLTIPAGPAGRHLHWVLRLPNGTYVYPPTKITEPFGGSQGGTNVILTEEDAKTLYRRLFNREGDAGGVKNYTGKTLDFALNDMLGSQEFKNGHTVEKVVERIVERPVEVIKEIPGGTTADPDGQKWRDLKVLHKELYA